MFLVAASLFVFAACSSEDDSSPEVNPENAAITFELSAVNGLTDGIGTGCRCIARRPHSMSLVSVFMLCAERLDLSASKDL